MREFFSQEQIDKLLSCYATIEQRFAELLPELKLEEPRWLSALLTSKRTNSSPPLWRQETEDIVRAFAANDKQELSSLMNLHALNAAIEAARYKDANLARHAEVLRRFSEEARNFIAKQ